MSEPVRPKRKFWQFHLSTAVFMMAFGSVFLYLNCRVPIVKVAFTLDANGDAIEWLDAPEDFKEFGLYRRGFPFAFHWFDSNGGEMQLRPLLYNIGIGVITLLISAGVFESILRSSEARKQ